jgi:Ser/Thr protein kinase RdoA (MazF antagonist)
MTMSDAVMMLRCAACCCLQTPQLLRSVGRYLARVDAALSDFWHPGIRPTHDWAIERVLDAVQQFSHLLPDAAERCVLMLVLGQLQ